MTINVKRNPYRIVNKPHQYRMLAAVLFYTIVLAVFLAFVFLLPDVLTIYDKTLGIEIRANASERILTLHSQAWPTIIAMICLIGLHSVRWFSRSIGPLYRFALAFREARDGNLGYHVILRKKDHLHREALLYNEMIDLISEKIAEIQAAGHESLQLLVEMEKGINKMGAQDETDTTNTDTLRKRLECIVASAGYFRTKASKSENMPSDPAEGILKSTFSDKNSLSNRPYSDPAAGLMLG